MEGLETCSPRRKTMKWFKHLSDGNRALDQIIADHGMEGYGRYWIIMEEIAGRAEAGSDDWSVEYSWTKWSSLLAGKRSKLLSFLLGSALQTEIKVESTENKMKITCLKMREYRNKSQKNLQVDCNQVAPRVDKIRVEKKREEKKREEKKEEPPAASEVAPKKKDPKKETGCMWDVPEPKGMEAINQLGQTLYHEEVNSEDGGWFIPDKHMAEYLELCRGDRVILWRHLDDIERWLHSNRQRWMQIRNLHMFVLNWLKK